MDARVKEFLSECPTKLASVERPRRGENLHHRQAPDALLIKMTLKRRFPVAIASIEQPDLYPMTWNVFSKSCQTNNP